MSFFIVFFIDVEFMDFFVLQGIEMGILRLFAFPCQQGALGILAELCESIMWFSKKTVMNVELL